MRAGEENESEEEVTTAVKTITVEQAEGEAHRMVSGTFPTFAEANKALRQVQYQCCPGMLGYYKTDVSIEWEDGSTHSLRADVKGDGSDTDLGTLLKHWAEFMLHGGAVWSTDTERKAKLLRSTKSLYGDKYPAAAEHAQRLLKGELVTS